MKTQEADTTTNTKKAIKRPTARRTAKKGASKRREWTKADETELTRFAKLRAKDRDAAPWKGTKGIVAKLQRTEGAIRQKAHAMGISLTK